MADAKGILPEGESLRRALRWLGERRQEDPKAQRAKIISEASERFDLSPVEEEFLLRDWKE